MPTCNLGNWNEKCQDILNKQINLELWASYQYLQIWNYFDKSNIALNNIAEFFRKSSLEETEHAQKLMKYQNKRGGNVGLYNIKEPSMDFLGTTNITSDVLKCFDKAIEMEQKVYKSLLEVHKIGDECNDPQFTDFIEGEFLEEQIDAINKLTKWASQLRRIGNDGHGIWNFDQHFPK
jgi:ferritin heavy chain